MTGATGAVLDAYEEWSKSEAEVGGETEVALGGLVGAS
jgi:hypothetical protein